MPRKASTKKTVETNKAESTQEIDAISIKGTVGAETMGNVSLDVKEISLNQKVESFFGLGTIWLSHSDYTAKVPDNLTENEKAILKSALKRGIVVEGNVYIPPIDKDPKVLDEYWDLVKNRGLNPADETSPSMVAFRKLFKAGVDRNWTAKEIANHCMQLEAKYKNRDKVLKLLKDTHRYSSCPDTLLEPIELKK